MSKMFCLIRKYCRKEMETGYPNKPSSLSEPSISLLSAAPYSQCMLLRTHVLAHGVHRFHLQTSKLLQHAAVTCENELKLLKANLHHDLHLLSGCLVLQQHKIIKYTDLAGSDCWLYCTCLWKENSVITSERQGFNWRCVYAIILLDVKAMTSAY